MNELRKRLFLRLSTLFTLTACFTVLGAGILFANNLQRMLSLWGDDLQITAYLDQSEAAPGISAVSQKLSADKRIKKYELITREQALQDFRAQMASYAPDLAGDEELLQLIPSSFRISVDSTVENPDQVKTIEAVAQDLKTTAGIEEVRYGQEWIQKYSAVLSAAKIFALAIGALVLAVSLLVIGNAVRASVEARRHEIEVLELVGADAWAIRRPFLMEGLWMGLISATLAILVTFGLFVGFKDLLSEQLQFLQMANHLGFLGITVMAIMVAGGGLIGILASFLCVRGINDGFAAAGARF